jgi:hypothetical protein
MAGTGIQSFVECCAGILDLWHSALKHSAECQPPLSNELRNANSMVKFARGMPQAEQLRS